MFSTFLAPDKVGSNSLSQQAVNSLVRNHKNDGVFLYLGWTTKWGFVKCCRCKLEGAEAGSRWSHVSRSRAVVTEVCSRPASDGSIVFYDFNRVHKMADKWWHAADELNKLRAITDRLVTRSPVRSRGSRGRVAAEAPVLRGDDLARCLRRAVRFVLPPGRLIID